RGEIEVSSVCFCYSDNGFDVLKNVILQVKLGEFIGIVGASGSGKSTLFRMLLGFEQPVSGTIYYDGRDLAELDLRLLRRQFGVVLQNGRILGGDLLKNIIGMSRLTVDDAWAAARMAGLDQDIAAMPMGMHTYITEGGGTLSGGQRQRLLIARALVHQPRILMLDEATSALDNITQNIVGESLAKLDATRLVIAHRLSTIINADRIYVMANGEVVEHGSYEELMRMNGTFADLARRQII
ncbi:MAG TPA: ATP-binding cassette domain-containing protein, partial [bacterium]|nr:ATP-binding cassette domain-containing protein [bacterium]